MITINARHWTPESITVEVTRPLTMGLNSMSLRTLILQTAAFQMGKSLKDMYDAGYDRTHADGWERTDGPLVGGNKTTIYKVRPMSAPEVRARYREQGGFVSNADGSMGFIMPQPSRRGQVSVSQQGKVKVRRQK